MFGKKLFRSKYSLPFNLKVFTVEDYKALPREQREKNGWYLEPCGLHCDVLNFKKKKSEWDKFYEFIRQEYPLQWFVRYWLTSWDNPIYSFCKLRHMKYVELKYSIKRYFNPLFSRWRKSCRRHEHKDICTLVIDSNFALILDFWYEEIVDGHVDWQSDSIHKQFYNQIKAYVKYIEDGRNKLIDKSNNELTRATNKSRKLSYEERYKKYNKLEQEIKDKDTEIVMWFVKNREFFWT